MNSKLVSAFTILEVVITMIISSIVILLAYMLLSTIQDEWQQIKANQSNTTELIMFKHTFENDIDKCEYILFTEPNTYVLRFTNDSVLYSFGKIIIRRSLGTVDSFAIECKNVTKHYLTQKKTSVLIDSIRIDISSPVSIKSALFEKKYSSSELINIYQKDSL